VKKLLIIPLLWCSILMAANPSRAMLYSAVVPGGGQIYNKAYIKAGIVISLQAWNIGRAIHNKSEADHLLKKSHESSNPMDILFYKARSEEFHEKYTSDIWWIAITAALSVIDAYVDAHLADFDEKRDTLHLKFDEGKVGLEYRF